MQPLNILVKAISFFIEQLHIIRCIENVLLFFGPTSNIHAVTVWVWIVVLFAENQYSAVSVNNFWTSVMACYSLLRLLSH